MPKHSLEIAKCYCFSPFPPIPFSPISSKMITIVIHCCCLRCHLRSIFTPLCWFPLMLLHQHFKKYLPATLQSSYVPLSGQPDDIILLSSRVVMGLKHEITLGLSFILLEKLGVGGSNQKPSFSSSHSWYLFYLYMRIRPRCVMLCTAKKGSGLHRGRIPQIIYYPVAAFSLMKQHMKL